VRQQLLDLLEVQKIDLAIREIEQRQEALPASLKELEARIQTTKQEIATLNEERERIDKEVRVHEGTVHAENEKIRKWEKRLNEIRNQREYLALSREVEGSKRANREVEEQILELMKRKEEIDGSVEELSDRLAEDEVDCETERSRVQEELDASTAQVEEHTKRREVVLPRIPKQLLRKYDNIRAKRLGIGLVAVTDGSCKGCNMRLPPQLYNILQRADTIEQCPSCNRIIYFEGLIPIEEPANQSAVSASP